MLALSSRGRYATRIVVLLASRGEQALVTTQEISAAEDISQDYVEQILSKLKAAGMVRSRRGMRGGYTLARDAGQITVADVWEAVEGPVCLSSCIRDGCTRQNVCVTQAVWRDANNALEAVLAGVTIGQLARESVQPRVGGPPTFQI